MMDNDFPHLKLASSAANRFPTRIICSSIAVFSIICLGHLLSVPAVPPYQKVKSTHEGSDIFVLDREKRLLATARKDFKQRSFPWVSLGEIPASLLNLVVRQEDRGFYGHYGFSPSAIVRSAYQSLKGRRQGASTITMQLVSFFTNKTRPNVYEKLQEIEAAVKLERGWSKAEILEAYLNLLPLRGEVVGVNAASLTLFGKSPAALSVEEQATLAAMIQRPNALPAAIAQRACRLAEMEPCHITYIPSSVILPVDTVLAHGLQATKSGVYPTTIDAQLQDTATEIATRSVRQLSTFNVHDAAVLVVSNSTGEVLSYVANIGSTASRPYVDGIRAQRSVGSVLKPFLYAAAFEEGFITDQSQIKDMPFDKALSMGAYMPQNYDKRYRGMVSVRTALASSLNIPAVRLLDMFGVQHFGSKLLSYGIHLPHESDRYGLSLILGSPSLSLWELVRAYRMLANRGEISDISQILPSTVSKPESTALAPSLAPRVLRREAADEVIDILSDRSARADTFGLENALATRFFSAVKTGTSRDMIDNWCIGFSDEVTVGVWVGNFDGAPMWNVTGVTGAAPIWNEVIGVASQRARELQIPPVSFAPSSTLSSVVIPSTNPLPTIPRPSTASVKILSPKNGQILAFDSDAGTTLSKIPIEYSCPRGDCSLTINGASVDSATNGKVMWQGKSGLITIELRERNKLKDRQQFSVR